jgi:putative transposase
MKANQVRWPVATMARLLKVSTSGFYAWLRRQGLSKHTVDDARLRARIRTLHASLCGASRRRAKLTTHPRAGARRAPDLVRRHFSAEAPNVRWVADATCSPTVAGFLYLPVVLDVFSRRIVGWAMSHSLYTDLMVRALDMALLQPRPAHLLDQRCCDDWLNPPLPGKRGCSTELATGHQCAVAHAPNTSLTCPFPSLSRFCRRPCDDATGRCDFSIA